MEKILITGGTGLLGNKMVNYRSEDYSIIGTYHKIKPDFINNIKFDMLNKKQLQIVEKSNQIL